MGFFRKRRNRIVEDNLIRNIAVGRLDFELDHLYFEAACAYARDNGGTLYPDTPDQIMFDKEFYGENYSVFFSLARRGGGTSVLLNRSPTAYDLIAVDAERFAAKQRADGELALHPENYLLITCLRDATTAGRSKTYQYSFDDEILDLLFSAWSTEIPSRCQAIEGNSHRVSILEVPGSGCRVVSIIVFAGTTAIAVGEELDRSELIINKEFFESKLEEASRNTLPEVIAAAGQLGAENG